MFMAKYISMDEIDKFLLDNFMSYSMDSSRGFAGKWPNIITRFNPTTHQFKSIGAVISVTSQMKNRLGFTVHKVDEITDISPSHPHYNSVTRQKQDIIRQIKESFAQVDRAISDTELLEHDLRKYKEILSYFHEGDEHSLKAMFIDQVDIHTGEGISMRSIAPRWPTIIADFMALDPEKDVTVDDVQNKVKISKAEAVILTTKIKLYNKWRDFFKGAVTTRYGRIKQRAVARRKSIEEYGNWARPLIRRAQQMREVDDHSLIMQAVIPTGIGTPVSIQALEYWGWTKLEGTEQVEMHRAPRETYTAGDQPRFVVEPYDEVVRAFIPKIEKKHGIKVTPKIILDARKKLFSEGSPGSLWYAFIRIPVDIATYLLPDGSMFEDTDFNPLEGRIVTQNVMLIKMIELVIEELRFNTYIDEMLGQQVMLPPKEDEPEIKSPVDLKTLLEKDFPDFYGGKKEEDSADTKKSIKDIGSSIKKPLVSAQKWINDIFGIKLAFFKRGHYDPDYNDSMAYRYGRPFFRTMWNTEIFGVLKSKFGAI